MASELRLAGGTAATGGELWVNQISLGSARRHMAGLAINPKVVQSTDAAPTMSSRAVGRLPALGPMTVTPVTPWR